MNRKGLSLTTRNSKKFNLDEQVTVIAEGRYRGERGRVVIINDKLLTPFGVVFDWDVSGMPWYFSEDELERGDE